MPNIILPDTLYHGTLLSKLPEFRVKVINAEKWIVKHKDKVQRRDFGFGLYTSTDFERVARFVRSKIEANHHLHDERPCILELKVIKEEKFASVFADSVIHLGISREWSECIFHHRYENELEANPEGHPSLIVGPIADNSFKKVLSSLKRMIAAKLEGRKHLSEQERTELLTWFQDEIIHNKERIRLPFAELNQQIVFLNDESQVLRLVRYYTYNEITEGWEIHYEYPEFVV